MTPDQQLALPCKISCTGERAQVWGGLCRRRVRANLVTRESKCRRIAIRFSHGRCSLSGDSIKANTRRGVFRVKIKSSHQAFAGNDDSRPKSRENGMKEATKRAASEALAQLLAVTAMLVIASFIFYWR
jgi:hypothetical protein